MKRERFLQVTDGKCRRRRGPNTCPPRIGRRNFGRTDEGVPDVVVGVVMVKS